MSACGAESAGDGVDAEEELGEKLGAGVGRGGAPGGEEVDLAFVEGAEGGAAEFEGFEHAWAAGGEGAAEDIGDDRVWDNWRLEGPSFVWHFRGSPHVHVWVNVADSASANQVGAKRMHYDRK